MSTRQTGRRRLSLRGLAAGVAAAAMFAAAALVGLDRLDRAFPPPLAGVADLSVEMVDRDGVALRVFANDAGRWRLKADLDRIDPVFLDMLVAYEDKRFRRHHGIDVLAMARAAGQFA
ncbi:MAG: transglycosylase domain-containing protein, partial [Pseudomonadota bacterium]|nr:transglycosylase domain-containing protein [Pseudomonadota bacterium]